MKISAVDHKFLTKAWKQLDPFCAQPLMANVMPGTILEIFMLVYGWGDSRVNTFLFWVSMVNLGFAGING